MTETDADAPTLYIVDGSAYIYRAFYAVRRLSNSAGFPTNALYGFVNMFKKLIEQEDPDYLAMTFDRYDEEDEGKSFRHEMYEDYKANRSAMPDDLRVQVPYFLRFVEAMNVPVMIQSGVEADDVIATATRRARQEGLGVCIISADKDLMQLLGRTCDARYDARQGPSTPTRSWSASGHARQGQVRPGAGRRLQRQHPGRAGHRREDRRQA